LVQAEKDIGGDDHPPARSERDEGRNWEGKKPAQDEKALSPRSLGEPAGREVRERLRQPKGDDEGEDRALRGEAKVILADQREDAPFETNHRPDECVHGDEKSELTGVRSKAEANPGRAHACVGERPRLLAATIAAWSGGGGGRSTSKARTNVSSSA
jgi:hypothetical protein